MNRFEILIDEIVLDSADAHRDSVLHDAVQQAVRRAIAGVPITPRSAKSAVAEQVARSVTNAVVARGGTP